MDDLLAEIYTEQHGIYSIDGLPLFKSVIRQTFFRIAFYTSWSMR